MRTVFIVFVAIVASSMATRHAHADLQADVERLVQGWQTGADVQRLEPRMLERGELLPILVPRSAVSSGEDGCTRITLLGPPSANFVLRFLPHPDGKRWIEEEWPEPSIAGAAEITRCGARRASLGRLVVEMRSPRALLEFVVTQAKEPPAPYVKLLPHRDPGPILGESSAGPRPAPPPLDQRVASLSSQLSSQGATLGAHQLPGTSSGAAEVPLELEPGCHRIMVLGDVPADAERVHDIDMALATLPQSEGLVRDQTENSDASVDHCVGEATVARVQFAGALPNAPVVLLHARWPLPEGLPLYWGPRARARMASALRPEQLRTVSGSPVLASLGVQGETSLPFEVEPGACYFAAVTSIRGVAHGLGMAVHIGSALSQNRLPHDEHGTSIAFCNSSPIRHAALEVEARGAGMTWLAAIWQVSRLSTLEAPE